jgi:heptosyltransferase-3
MLMKDITLYGDYPDLTSVKKILVIKLRQLGDVLLTGPVFSALKSRMPAAQIDAYVYSESIPMLDGHPSLHECIGYDRSWKKGSFYQRILNELRVLRRIRAGRYDLVINLTEGDRGAVAAKISGAKIRVGFDPKGSGLKGKKKLYTHVVKNCPSLRHTVERNLDAVRRIGIFPAQNERDLSLHIPDTDLKKMWGLAGSGFILIHPTSRWRFKCMPVEKMRTLAEILVSRGHSLVFTSGPDKDELAMIQEISGAVPCLDLAGKVTLKELAALIELSAQVICVDSLPLHIASALKKPVLAIFGPTSDVTWGPWRNPAAQIVSQNFSCRPCHQDGCGGSKRSECLTTLSVETVLHALDMRHPSLCKISRNALVSPSCEAISSTEGLNR